MSANELRDIDHGYEKLKAIFKEIKSSAVTVGIRGDAGGDLVMIANIHEFGAPEAGIPARAPLRTAMDANRAKYADMLRSGAVRILKGELTLRQLLGMVGATTVADVQRTIASNLPPPLAPATIEAKGSSVALIDTGAMRQAYDWQIEGE